MLAVGERDAGIGRHGRCRGNARHYLEGDVVIDEIFGLLPSPAEDERVASLEPGNDLSFACLLDDQRIDLFLRKRVPAPLLANVYKLGVGSPMIEDPFIREIVVNDHVRLFHALQALNRDQARIAWARAY